MQNNASELQLGLLLLRFVLAEFCFWLSSTLLAAEILVADMASEVQHHFQ